MPDTDDKTILDGHSLWRRVHPDWIILDKNIDPPAYRPTSQAFQNYRNTDTMSVLLGDDHREPNLAVSGIHGTYSLAAFPALLARQQDQVIVRAPEATEPTHAHVVGKKTGSVRSALAKGCRWEVLRRST